ncbi:MAG TPA: TetR family transcriptional regulator [Actinocrinis sp.]|nr:TetR family transcriptional regulator [Actinocrinis sp.]
MAVRDPEATKARIFAAATAEFAAYGIAGARVDRIAQNAHANKQLIYAYFGDKAELFAHVLEQKLVEVAESVSMEVNDIEDWIECHFDYHAQHPELLRLLMWEALEFGSTGLPRPEARVARYQEKVANFAKAQQNGVVRTDVQPAHLLLLMLGLINWPQAANQVSGMILGEDVSTSADFRESVKKCARSLAGPQGEHCAEPKAVQPQD